MGSVHTKSYAWMELFYGQKKSEDAKYNLIYLFSQ